MLLPILRWPDPRLLAPCPPAAPSEAISALAADMLETMYAAPGRGLAAPQVGQLVRMFVMDTDWKDGERSPRVFLNPELSEPSEALQSYDEGCLSLPGFTLSVERPAAVTIRWQELDGSWRQERLEGMAAICAQHEYDHLDGVLILDRAAPEALVAAEPQIAALRTAAAAGATRGQAAPSAAVASAGRDARWAADAERPVAAGASASAVLPAGGSVAGTDTGTGADTGAAAVSGSGEVYGANTDPAAGAGRDEA